MNAKAAARHQRAKRGIDCAIRAAIESFEKSPTNRFELCRLVSHVRAQSEMLSAAGDSGKSNQVGCLRWLTGLVALAKHHRQWLRDVEDWRAPNVSPRDQFAALARFLLAHKPVPAFMTNVWLAEPTGEAWQYQQWFKHMALVGTIRGADTPFRMNKKQAYLFATSPAHYSVAEALRRAQRGELPQAIKPIYPAGLSRRRRKRAVGGAFALADRRYPRSRVHPFSHVVRRRYPQFDQYWTIRQLRSFRKLQAEGQAMQHCVATYDDLCRSGATSIWSMCCHDGQSNRRCLTVEVRPRRGVIYEALGFENRVATQEERDILHLWAKAEWLKLASWV